MSIARETEDDWQQYAGTRSRRRFLGLAAAAVMTPWGLRFAGAAQETARPASPPDEKPIVPLEPITLFNGRDLSGFHTYLQTQGVDNDPNRVFSVEKGAVRLSGQETGYLFTAANYADYHLTFEVRWGEKRWPPHDQPNTSRDSGCLLHVSGPNRIWPRCLECQLQENDFGDLFHLSGISSLVKGKRQSGRALRTLPREKPRGEWNTVEAICKGDTVRVIVNGAVENEVTGLTKGRNGTGGPLTAGQIAFQTQGAEIFFRNLVLRPVG